MKEVNPQETGRAYAFEMWMNAPMPMVTFFKTLDVSRLEALGWRPQVGLEDMYRKLIAYMG